MDRRKSLIGWLTVTFCVLLLIVPLLWERLAGPERPLWTPSLRRSFDAVLAVYDKTYDEFPYVVRCAVIKDDVWPFEVLRFENGEWLSIGRGWIDGETFEVRDVQVAANAVGKVPGGFDKFPYTAPPWVLRAGPTAVLLKTYVVAYATVEALHHHKWLDRGETLCFLFERAEEKGRLYSKCYKFSHGAAHDYGHQLVNKVTHEVEWLPSG